MSSVEGFAVVDPTRPHPARIYDYGIGGTNPATGNAHEVAQRADPGFSQPVALVLVSVIPFLVDEDKPAEILATLLDALPSGSCLAATHTTAEHDPRGWEAVSKAYGAAAIAGPAPGTRRTSPGWRSAAWSSCRPAWSSFRDGGPTTPARVRRPPRSAATAAWPANDERALGAIAAGGLR